MQLLNSRKKSQFFKCCYQENTIYFDFFLSQIKWQKFAAVAAGEKQEVGKQLIHV